MVFPNDIPPTVKIPITEELDLHHFRPEEVGRLLTDYFNECLQMGIFRVRIIHGKGSGILKRRVHARLEKMKAVASFQDAPPEAGGWGATIVNLTS